MSMRNIVLSVSAGVILLLGGIAFVVGKYSISADVSDSKNCKYYVFTDRKQYSPGQEITVGIKNDKYSKCTIKLRTDTTPWQAIDASGRTVYTYRVNQKITTLKPGNKANWTWNGQLSTGAMLSPGDYKIKFNSPDSTSEFSVSEY